MSILTILFLVWFSTGHPLSTRLHAVIVLPHKLTPPLSFLLSSHYGTLYPMKPKPPPPFPPLDKLFPYYHLKISY